MDKRRIPVGSKIRSWLVWVIPFFVSIGMAFGALIGMSCVSDAVTKEGQAGDKAGAAGALMIVICIVTGFFMKVYRETIDKLGFYEAFIGHIYRVENLIVFPYINLAVSNHRRQLATLMSLSDLLAAEAHEKFSLWGKLSNQKFLPCRAVKPKNMIGFSATACKAATPPREAPIFYLIVKR